MFKMDCRCWIPPSCYISGLVQKKISGNIYNAFISFLTFVTHYFIFKGHCNFQNGPCGLKPEKNAAFHWTVGSGQTPTESTGPSYDHTSFKKDGKKRSKETTANTSLTIVNNSILLYLLL